MFSRPHIQWPSDILTSASPTRALDALKWLRQNCPHDWIVPGLKLKEMIPFMEIKSMLLALAGDNSTSFKRDSIIFIPAKNTDRQQNIVFYGRDVSLVDLEAKYVLKKECEDTQIPFYHTTVAHPHTAATEIKKYLLEHDCGEYYVVGILGDVIHHLSKKEEDKLAKATGTNPFTISENHAVAFCVWRDECQPGKPYHVIFKDNMKNTTHKRFHIVPCWFLRAFGDNTIFHGMQPYSQNELDALPNDYLCVWYAWTSIMTWIDNGPPSTDGAPIIPNSDWNAMSAIECAWNHILCGEKQTQFGCSKQAGIRCGSLSRSNLVDHILMHRRPAEMYAIHGLTAPALRSGKRPVRKGARR